jgi:hypothetical protein
MKLLIPEILDKLNHASSQEEKIKIYLEEKSECLDIILYLLLSDKSKNSLYKQIDKFPKYRVDDSPIGYAYTTLYREYKNLVYFYQGSKMIHNEKRRKHKLIQVLESIHFMESALVENLLTGRQIYTNLKPEDFSKYIPALASYIKRRDLNV